jgi:hypothetical protein
MPYKNRGDKIEATRRWRESSTPEYHKWLYARRAFRFDKAATYERLLKMIANREVSDPVDAARAWLDEMDAREKKVGRWFNHETNRPSNKRHVTRRR